MVMKMGSRNSQSDECPFLNNYADSMLFKAKNAESKTEHLGLPLSCCIFILETCKFQSLGISSDKNRIGEISYNPKN